MKNARSFDPDVGRPVDHDLGNALVSEESLDRTVTEDVVREFLHEALSVRSGNAGFLAEALMHLSPYPIAQCKRGDFCVEQLTAEILDQSEVNTILRLGERILV
jgi:hypothetical protein